jgi:hypothetical protein
MMAVTLSRGIKPSGTPLLLLLLLGDDPMSAGFIGGQVLSRFTARSHTGRTVSCKLLLLLLLPLLALLLLLLLPVQSRFPGCTTARLFQNPSSCSAMHTSVSSGKSPGSVLLLLCLLLLRAAEVSLLTAVMLLRP